MYGHPQRNSKEHIRWRNSGQAPIQEVSLVLWQSFNSILYTHHGGILSHLPSTCAPFNLKFDDYIFESANLNILKYVICILRKGKKNIHQTASFVWFVQETRWMWSLYLKNYIDVCERRCTRCHLLVVTSETLVAMPRPSLPYILLIQGWVAVAAGEAELCTSPSPGVPKICYHF